METKDSSLEFTKGFWRPEEDMILKKYVETHGEGNWTLVSKKSGLLRGAKSCRLRWKNYLRPNLKRGTMSEDEKDLIIRLHKLLGNRWSLIAGRLPGRTDNEVKNYWNTHLNKKRRPPHGRDQITSHHPCNYSSSNDKQKLSMAVSTGLGSQEENEARPEIISKEGDTFVLDSWVDFELETADCGPKTPIEPMLFTNSHESFIPMLDDFLFFGEPFEVCSSWVLQ